MAGVTGGGNRKGSGKKRYIPGLASIRFSPDDYWTPDEARRRYEEASCHPVDQDTILFEDCIRGMERMPSSSVDLVVADPPFGIEFSGKASAYNRNSDHVVDAYHEVDQDYAAFTEAWMGEVQRIMKPHASAYVFSGWNHLEDVLRGARESDLTTINHIIWRYQFGVFTRRKYVTSHYHVILLVKDPYQYYFNKMEPYPEDVWDIKRKYTVGEAKNATTLPVEVVKRCIEFSSRPGDLVFDPFMGMGTTAVVAKSIWRHYFGFEKNLQMKELLQKRIDTVAHGEAYVTLEERLEKIRAAAREKYPAAYDVFRKESGEHADTRS